MAAEWTCRGGTRKTCTAKLLAHHEAGKPSARSKVKEQTNFQAGSAQVIQKLLAFAGTDRCAGLELDDYATLHEHVGPEVSDLLIPVPDWNRRLKLESHSSLSHLHRKRAAVDGLQKAVTEFEVHSVKRTQNFPRDLPM